MSNVFTPTAEREKCQHNGILWDLGTSTYFEHIFCQLEKAIHPARGDILLRVKDKSAQRRMTKYLKLSE